jgi:hypothetical protein
MRALSKLAAPGAPRLALPRPHCLLEPALLLVIALGARMERHTQEEVALGGLVVGQAPWIFRTRSALSFRVLARV